jgi:transposase InsO family protein
MISWITARPAANRVARLTRLAGIKAQIGYKRQLGSYGGKPSLVIDNRLARQFDVAAPHRTWVTDITYIRTLAQSARSCDFGQVEERTLNA